MAAVRIGATSLLISLACATAHAQPTPPTGEPVPTEPTPPDPVPPPVVTPHPPVAPEPPTPPAASPADDWSFRPGGFIQPAYRMRQNAGAPDENDGFRLVRARLTATGAGHIATLAVGAYLEAELQPSFSLFDAYVTVSHALPHQLVLTVDAGQMRVPISRQQLLSDTRLSFVNKAQISSIAPERDLGARATLAMPHVRLMVGSFNGEGKDQGQNINESFLHAGRLEITPIGDQAPYVESAFAPTWLSFGASVGLDKLTPGAYHENETFLGVDVAGAWRGLSGTFEYLQVQHDFKDASGGVMLQSNYRANGFVAQAAYLLPIELPAGRLELAARVEEIDRNDVTPIAQIGDPNQSVRTYTGVVSYYLKEHRAKLQLEASHFQELEDKTSTGQSATYANDQLLLQLTYRVE
jgi:hypothetical protein